MTIEDILIGESKTIEFKEMLPEKSIKYMKTVVAYANGNGGKLIFGVKDDTHEVVGIEEENIFQTIDAITNAIVDSCEPMIIPDITLQTINNKTIIVVEITRGKQRPYYIKSLGMDQGIYIRISGTTRLADDFKVKELMFEGANKFYDQAPCLGLSISENDITNLCQSLKNTALKNCIYEADKADLKDVTKNTLLSWGILFEKDGECLPTNAFALLTGNPILSTMIQCGVFKGTNRAIFVDRREFTGSIQDQVEQAYRYVLSKINLGATINGLYRRDVYELPIESIREVIANAITHRSYLDPGNVQVALYDDRLEVTSPGMLLNGVTIEKMKEGYSKVRNRAIAKAFAYMKIIEEWGSGIPRMMDEFKKQNLRDPELIDFDGDFRVNFYRNYLSDIKQSNKLKSQAATQAAQNTTQAPQNTTQAAQNTTQAAQNTTQASQNTTQAPQNTTQAAQNTTQASQNTTQAVQKTTQNHLNESEQNIINIISMKPTITQNNIADLMGISLNNVKYYIKRLRKKGVLIRTGTNQKGKWIVKM